MPGVGVTFGAKDTGLDAMNRKVAKSADMLPAAYKRGAREIKEQERAALSALRNMNSASNKYQNTLRGLNEMVRAGKITQDQATQAARNYRREISQIGSLQSSLVGSLKGFAQTWLGIQAIARVVTGEMQIQADLIDRGATAQQNLAKATRSLFAQFPGDKPAERQRLLDTVLASSQGLRIRPVQLVNVASELAGATLGGFAKREETIGRTLKQIAPLFISKPEEAGAFAGALQAFFQTTSLKSVGLKDEEAFSLLLQARGQSRITSEEKLKNFIPVVKTLEATTEGQLTRQDLRVAAGLFAQISSRAEDPDANKTRTAMVKMIEVLENRFPDRPLQQQLDDAAKLSDRQREEFVKPLSALKGIGPIVKDILKGRQSEQFEELMKAINFNTETNRQFMDQLLFGNEVLRQDTATREMQARQELALLERPGVAGARRRMLPGEGGQGFIAEQARFGEAFMIQGIARALLSLGVDPQAVETIAAQQSARGMGGLPMLFTNNERLAELNETLRIINEAYRSDRAPVKPEQ